MLFRKFQNFWAHPKHMSSFGVAQVHGEKCASRHHSRERGADCISLNLRSLHWRLDWMGSHGVCAISVHFGKMT